MAVLRRILMASLGRSLSTGRMPLVFSRAGLPMETIGPEGELCALSRRVRRHQLIPREAAAFSAALAERLESDPPDELIWGDDRSIEAAISHPHPVFDRWWPIDAARTPPRALIFKTDFEEWARGTGIDLPQARIAHSCEEAVQSAGEIGAPVVIKPSRGTAGAGIFRADTPADVSAHWKHDVQGSWIVQEFIAGLRVILVVASRRGVPTMAILCEKTASNGPWGISLRRRYFNHPAILSAAEALCGGCGFTGLGGADMVLQADGRLRMIEMSFRPVAGFHMAHLIGVPIAEVLRRTFTDTGEPGACHTTVRPAGEWPAFPECLSMPLLRNEYGTAASALASVNMWRSMPWGDPPILRAGWGQVADALAVKARALKRLACGDAPPAS